MHSGSIQTIIIIVMVISTAIGKCHNSSDFKYDLKEPSELVNYHSLCSDFTKRTCCSSQNFESLSKKISKLMGGNIGLSKSCRFRMTRTLCSVCDGDVGQNLRDGLCPQYCHKFYDQCQEDYFSFDNNNQLKACKEDDIICSKLKDIIHNNNKQKVCELLSLKVGVYNCWNGQVSAMFKGPGKQKINVTPKTRQKKKKQPSLLEQISKYKRMLIFVALGLVIFGYYQYRKYQARYALWKRQIRNL